MAVITCPECHKNMSDSAATCPTCGKPNQSAMARKRSVSFLLGLGIFFIPVIFSWFTLRKGYGVLAKVISFAWLAFSLIMFGLINGINLENESNKMLLASHGRIKQVELKDMLAAYTNNELDADNQYKGKMVQITGQVDTVKKDIIGNLYVIFIPASGAQPPYMQAFFSESMANQLSQLKVGSYLTVVCKIDGLAMNIIANSCIIHC